MKRHCIALRALSIAALALSLVACHAQNITPPAAPAKSRGQLLFEEKCRTEAGEKIYRTVEDVEGLVLLKMRAQPSARDFEDVMWPGAAFSVERYGDDYIGSFLGYEHTRENALTGEKFPITSSTRGYITTDKRPGSLPGYRYVDVIDAKNGKRYRYTGRWEEPWQYDKSYLKGYIKFFLDKAPAPVTSPRYGVTYEDHVIPEERYLGVASSTVKVIDLQTQEVLGEMTRYAWGATSPSPSNPSPWLSAHQCPRTTRPADTQTRQFVDQILIPRKDQ